MRTEAPELAELAPEPADGHTDHVLVGRRRFPTPSAAASTATPPGSVAFDQCGEHVGFPPGELHVLVADEHGLALHLDGRAAELA